MKKQLQICQLGITLCFSVVYTSSTYAQDTLQKKDTTNLSQVFAKDTIPTKDTTNTTQLLKKDTVSNTDAASIAQTSTKDAITNKDTLFYEARKKLTKRQVKQGESHWGVFDQTVKYTFDTLFDKPNGNKLMVIAGFQGDADASGNGSGYYGAYLRGRYNLGKFFQVSGMYCRAVTSAPVDKPGYEYNIIEAQGAVFFSDKMETENRSFKIKGIIKERKRGYGAFTVEVKQKYGAEAELPVPKSVRIGITGGFFNWTRPMLRGQKDTMAFTAKNEKTGSSNYKDNMYANINVTGFSAGFAMTTNVKARYRFHSYNVEQNLQQESERTYKITGDGAKVDKGFKNGTRNMSVDIALELLVAPGIMVQRTSTVIENGITQKYDISNMKLQHTGFRIRSELRNKIFSLRFEIGMRPGMSYHISGDEKPNTVAKLLNGAYYLLGVGIGIGAL